MAERQTYRLGIDIGGTFTDLVLVGSDGSVRTGKLASTPDDYGRAIVEGVAALLESAGVAPGQVESVVHATTVATNAVLEQSGARTALITTAGFRDVLEMRRLRIPEMYNLQYEKPPPLVPRRFRCEVDERLGPNGEVWRPLDEDGARELGLKLAAAGIEAVAISLLHAYANPAHEERVEALLREVPGWRPYMARSSAVLPEIREYERTSTTVVSAYVGPVVESYLGRLAAQLEGIGLACPLVVMQSSGGAMTAEAAVSRPAHILESGPAAGVIACASLARRHGHANVISLDMGGTTAKAAIVEDGSPARTAEYEVGAGINLSSKLVKGGGHAVRLPFIDVSEIGAGGGSIVSLDADRGIRVGPRSAGAVPGPVCYGRGGEQPTFTDAVLALGYLNPHALAGGAVRLDPEGARAALADRIAAPLGKPPLEAAHGVYLLAAATMTRAVKAVSTYRGRDPRDFALVAFGGCGPIVAAAIARALRMERVLVPRHPGVFSAFGLPLTEIEHEFARTFFVRGLEIEAGDVERAFRELEAQAHEAMAAEGLSADRVSLRRFAELRYSGQAYELTVAVPEGALDLGALARDFGAEHQRTYGHRAEEGAVDLVNLKVAARGPGIPRPGAAAASEPARPATGRDAYFGPERGLMATPVLGRSALDRTPRAGPLIVEEFDSTCVVPPGARARLDDSGTIEILLDAAA